MSLSGANLANGNPKGDRREADFYATPPEATTALVASGLLKSDMIVWEPCCGDGAISKVLRQAGFTVASSDLFDRGFGKIGVNFLKDAPPPLVQQIITNPPFKESEAMIRHAFGTLGLRHGAFLLKSQYWHAAGRQLLFKDFPPDYVLPLTWRPDFSGIGGSPTMDVLWSVWTGMSGRTEYRPIPKP